jgi:nicotinate-nucleotide pyrophosphorylase (carboxylating)
MMDKNLLQAIEPLIEAGLKEDVGTGDITTNLLIPAESQTTAVLIAKSDGIIAGLQLAEKIFQKLDPKVNFVTNIEDGERVSKGQPIATIHGAYRALLTGERLALKLSSTHVGHCHRNSKIRRGC